MYFDNYKDAFSVWNILSSYVTLHQQDMDTVFRDVMDSTDSNQQVIISYVARLIKDIGLNTRCASYGDHLVHQVEQVLTQGGQASRAIDDSNDALAQLAE
jgi:hypothetical protein